MFLKKYFSDAQGFLKSNTKYYSQVKTLQKFTVQAD